MTERQAEDGSVGGSGGGNVGRGIGVAAVFALFGPLAGAILGLLVMAAAMAMVDGASGVMALAFWPMAIVIGAMVGFIPACLTGVAMAFASRWLRPAWLWVAVSGAVGFVVTLAAQRFTDMGGTLMIPGMGFGSAVICALITMGFRPR